MYGLPTDESFQFLIGRSLDQVCFGRYQVIFNFDAAVSISVEGGLGVRLPGAEETIVVDSRDVANVLVSAVGTRVVDVQVDDTRSLSLSFEDGLWLRVIDDQEEIESFTVSHGGPLIVV